MLTKRLMAAAGEQFSGKAPGALSFSVASTLRYNTMQPSGLLDFDETFSADSGQFTKYLGGTSTFSVASGTGTINNSGNVNCFIAEGAVLTMPQAFVSVKVVSGSSDTVNYNICGVGIVKDATDAVLAVYNRSGNYLQIYVNVSGTTHFSTGVNVGTLAYGFSIGLSIVGNSVCSWVNTGAGWTFVEGINIDSYVNLQTAITSYQAAFFTSTQSASSYGFQNFASGRFGGIAIRDVTLVCAEGGTPYTSGNLVYFTATVSDPEGYGYLGVFTMDLTNYAVTQTGAIMVDRASGIMNDTAGQIIFYTNGFRRLLVSTWGNATSGAPAVVEILETLLTGTELLSGTHVVSGMTALSLPPPGGANPGVYDPFLIFDSKLNRWLIAFCSDQDVGTSSYYIAAAYSPDLSSWTLISVDTSTPGSEGPKICIIGGIQYIIGASVYGAAPRIYDKNMNFLGTVTGTFTANGNTNPHCMMFSIGVITYVMTFDGAEYSDNIPYTWGNFIVETASRY